MTEFHNTGHHQDRMFSAYVAKRPDTSELDRREIELLRLIHEAEDCVMALQHRRRDNLRNGGTRLWRVIFDWRIRRQRRKLDGWRESRNQILTKRYGLDRSL